MDEAPSLSEGSENQQDLTHTPEPVADVDVTDENPPKASWKRVAAVVGGAAVAAAGTVVATLAATHKTAVSENAKAYVNGMNDALEAVRSGFDPFE